MEMKTILSAINVGLWIVRINAACRENEISYSRFINGLLATVGRGLTSDEK